MGKFIIVAAPSGSGKSSIIKSLVSSLPLVPSISATTRLPRGNEVDGVDYHFLGLSEFRNYIVNGDFLEYNEVYPGYFYGTLKDQIRDEINLVFDIDVEGGLRIKDFYKESALSLFIQPPSIEELHNRLIQRGTDSIEDIKLRLSKASRELSYSSKYDKIIINDDLNKAIRESIEVVKNFLL